jgi:D-3-phosphoglycerate dehydrogenase / 2-oxoglutarate reductase
MSATPFKIVHTAAPVGAELPMEREGLAEFAEGLVSYGVLDTPEKVIDACHDADAILIPGQLFPAQVIDKLERCRVLVRYGIGYDVIDVEAASRKGIVVVNFPDFCQREVANHALGLLLDCAKKISRQDRWIRSGGWRGGRSPFLQPMGAIHGETVGLVGFGAIAREFQRRLAVLEMKVIAYDPYVKPEVAAELGVELVSLDELLQRSDYVSIHVPLLPTTEGLFNAEKFALMKPTAYLLNTGRGPVVNTDALVAALENGTIAGAGLDTFAIEPLPADSPLLRLDNVVMTPHCASYADATALNLWRRVGHEAALALRGQMPNTPVNGTIKQNLSWLKA